MNLLRVYDYPKDQRRLDRLFSEAGESDPKVIEAVRGISEAVKREGDRAVCRFTKEFDGVSLKPGELRLSADSLGAAWRSLPGALRQCLRRAGRRIEAFHKRQRRSSWSMRDPLGVTLSQRWRALERVGIYVPGGSAAYPSTVLMNAIPARVAGVAEIVAVTPPAREGVYNAATLGALHLCGVREVYQVGGAQAIAALAHGTQTIRRVDKVVGPGNAYVAAAKRLHYGLIDIDSIAGPSEVLILADESAPLSWIAADLLAQAEHSPDAQALVALIGEAGTAERIAELQGHVRTMVEKSPRREILEQSLPERGGILRVADVDTAVELANRKAPEHLELAMRGARGLVRRIKHAGSIFVGLHTPEALGDYVAGPNHVLPTGGTARFASALSVEDFMRMTQIIEAKPKGFSALANDTLRLAEAEGLWAHAETIRVRRGK